MLKIAIVENDDDQAERLTGYITRFAADTGEECSAVRFRDGIDFVSDYTGDLDGIFMDIDMPLMDGMTAAERIRETDEDVPIVFVTNLAQYALRGYKVNAMDFLVKPVDYFEFSVELKKIARKKKSSTGEFIWLSAQGAHKRVPLSDIVYVDIMSHDIRIHTLADEIVFRGTLKDVEEKLTGNFSRCHNCYIVNLKYVESVNGDAVRLLHADDVAYISRNRRKKFMTDLTNYIATDGSTRKAKSGGR